MSRERNTKVIRIAKAVYDEAVKEKRPLYLQADVAWFSYLIIKGLEKFREGGKAENE